MKSAENKRIEFLINQLFIMNHSTESCTKKHKDFWEIDNGDRVKRTFEPDHPWLLNFGIGIDADADGDRIYCADPNVLVCEVEDIIGDSEEVLLLDGLTFKWTKYAKTDLSKYRNISTLNARCVYESHYRTMTIDGSGEYIKGLVATRGVNHADVFVNGEAIKNEQDQLFLSACLVEDFYREGVFHVRITHKASGKGLKLAVSCHEVLDLMKFRTAPNNTPSGQKNPVIHWVTKHLRKGKEKKSKINIDKHVRGLGSFDVDGYRITIKKPDHLLNEFGKVTKNYNKLGQFSE